MLVEICVRELGP